MKKVVLLIFISLMSLFLDAQKYELYVNASSGANSCLIISNIIRSLQVEPQVGYHIFFDNNFNFKKSSFGFGVGFKNFNYKIYVPQFFSEEISYNIIGLSVFYQKKINKLYFKTGLNNDFSVNNLIYKTKKLNDNNPYSLYTPSVFLESGLSINKFKIGLNIFSDFFPSYKLYFDNTIAAIYLSNGVFLSVGYKLINK